MLKSKRRTAFRVASLLMIILWMFFLGGNKQKTDRAYKALISGVRAEIMPAEGGAVSGCGNSISAEQAGACEPMPVTATGLGKGQLVNSPESRRERNSMHSALVLASRGGPSNDAVRVMEMEVVATGYSASREEGTERGITAIGTEARRGVVAVDPRVIPLGSEVYVPGYGWARAEDTGSAIKGRRIDLFFPSREEALQWGVRTVRVIVHLSGCRGAAAFKD